MKWLRDDRTAPDREGTMPGFRRVKSSMRCIMVGLAFLFFTPSALFAAGKVFPIQEFEEVRENWLGLETTVEGRRTVYDASLIKLKNSTIFFKPQIPLPKIITRSSNIQLTGTLQKVDGRLVFQVTAIAEGPNDLDQYFARERQLKRTAPTEWYDLADWVQRRGNFYKDSTLLEKARECRRRGFDIEREQLGEKDSEGRMALAARTAGLEVPDTIRQELVHEAYIIRYKAVQEKPEQAAIDQLLSDMEQDLPGCKTPLPVDDPALRQKYFISPESVYVDTKPAERPKLHRLLWSSIVLKRLEEQLAADFQNGFEIASKIDEVVPEFHARAETYREKMLQVRAANVENMTRAEVLQLRETYRERKQPKLGEEAVEGWLQWKKKRLKGDDIEGILSLADQYEELLNRRDMKLRILMDAAIIHPDSKDLGERLTKMGFRLHEGRWITDEAFRNRPEGRVEAAMQQGRVEVGMTGTQLRKSMGVPSTVTRVGSRNIVSEIWTYPNPGSKEPITVYLVRRLPSVEASVVDLGN